MQRRPLFLLAIGAVLVHAAVGCVGGTDESPLNPQPLPPGEPPTESNEPAGDRGEDSVGSSSGGGSAPETGIGDGGSLDGATEGGDP